MTTVMVDARAWISMALKRGRISVHALGIKRVVMNVLFSVQGDGGAQALHRLCAGQRASWTMRRYQGLLITFLTAFSMRQHDIIAESSSSVSMHQLVRRRV